jgi:multicomponent Na+:H+ antiporter subunit D
MTVEVRVLLALFLPCLGVVGILLARRRPNVREAVSLIVGVSLFLTVASLLGPVSGGADGHVVLARPIPGVALELRLEPLGLLFALVASFLWVVTTLYATGYMRGHGEGHQTRFFACFSGAFFGVVGAAFSGNLLTLFFFYEILTVVTYPLVTHAGTEAARRAGRTYLGILLSTSIGFLLFAIVWTWTIAGTVEFVPGGILGGRADPAAASVILALFVFGIGKAAVMPFHRWLPAAMVAPTPVSALLHAVAVVKTGVFALLKVSIYVFGTDYLVRVPAREWLLWVVATTIVLASLIAMRKENLKARLAYSTIGQLSYIVMGALLATPSASAGAGLHVVTHAFGKITLFFAAGAFLVAADKTEVRQLSGIGRRMPWTSGFFLIGSLSIIGLPPFGGMWSKWLLGAGTLEAGEPWLLGVLLFSALLNFAYLLPIPVRALFAEPDDPASLEGVREAPLACRIAMAITASGCVALFFFPGQLHDFLRPVLSVGP